MHSAGEALLPWISGQGTHRFFTHLLVSRVGQRPARHQCNVARAHALNSGQRHEDIGNVRAPLREPSQMPWTSNEAERHTRKATTPALKELWAKVANESLERTGDEGRAIREANAVVARQAGAAN